MQLLRASFHQLRANRGKAPHGGQARRATRALRAHQARARGHPRPGKTSGIPAQHRESGQRDRGRGRAEGQGRQRDSQRRARRDGAAQAVRLGQGGLCALRVGISEVRDDGRIPSRNRSMEEAGRSEGEGDDGRNSRYSPNGRPSSGLRVPRGPADAPCRQALGRSPSLR